MKRAAALLAALLLGGCGGGSAMPPAGAPGHEDRESGPAQAPETPVDGQPGYGQPGPAGTAEPVGPTEGGFAEAPALTLPEALDLFEQSASELSSGGLECGRACKAFASMQRASERICELNGPNDPGARCKKAKERLDEARETVRRRCGSCET